MSFFVYREIKKSLSGTLANRNHGKKIKLNYMYIMIIDICSVITGINPAQFYY